MNIQVPLLVIDGDVSRSCLHSSQTRRVHMLNVWYYEFMCFDVPKIVQGLGCDHGHDEESRNGRDINIDILDHVIRTPEVFRIVSDKTRVPKGERAAAKRWRPPHTQGESE